MPRRSAIVLTACLVACLEAPTAPELRLEHDPRWFDSVSLRWMPPSHGDVSGYAVEVRVVPEGFREVARFGPETVALWGATFGGALPAAPELSTVEFRVRALPEDDGARASNVVVHDRGLRAPSLGCAGPYWPCGPPAGEVRLSLQNRSLVADGLLLERRVGACGDATGAPWTPFLLAVDATSHVDAEPPPWVDGAVLEYRLSAVKGERRSFADDLRTDRAWLLAPTLVSATPVDGGVAIHFRNESRCAKSVVVVRRPAGGAPGVAWVRSVAAPPPGSSGEVLDPSPAAGTLVYAVWADGDLGLSSASVTTSVTWPPGAGGSP